MKSDSGTGILPVRQKKFAALCWFTDQQRLGRRFCRDALHASLRRTNPPWRQGGFTIVRTEQCSVPTSYVSDPERVVLRKTLFFQKSFQFLHQALHDIFFLNLLNDPSLSENQTYPSAASDTDIRLFCLAWTIYHTSHNCHLDWSF